MSVNEKMTAIADAIRDKTGGTEKLGLDEMAVGVGEVYEAGQQAEYDRFWDALQGEGGGRTDYDYVFSYAAWNLGTFKPKYDMVVESGDHMFYNSEVAGSLSKILNETGAKIVITTNANISSMFYGSKFTEISLDVTDMLGSSKQVFYNCSRLKTLNLKPFEDYATYSSWFTGCTSLENLILQGELYAYSLSVSACPLTHDSLMSIINALVDHTREPATGKLTLGSTNLAKLTDAEKAIATEKGWTLV